MGLNLPYLIWAIVVVFEFVVVVVGHLRQKQGVPTILTYHHLLSGYMGEIVSQELLIYTFSRHRATLLFIQSLVPAHSNKSPVFISAVEHAFTSRRVDGLIWTISVFVCVWMGEKCCKALWVVGTPERINASLFTYSQYQKTLSSVRKAAATTELLTLNYKYNCM